MNLQEMILCLKNYWGSKGCLIQEGYDIEVGAGTMNPATFLRCLGPEPYASVYVEPSRRPADGRYGKNPNRLQFYHQMQVIMKPPPEDIQNLYLQSLEACGLDLKKHDIRFVHDDWENPTIGAWGLGWEVWADGMEITQFTYFQSVGGVPVSPITVELTYGLERLAMYLQKVSSIFDLQWNETLLYKDLFAQNEWEWSHYNFLEADTDMWQAHFNAFEKEALSLAHKNWPVVAYDFVLKASHAFNMLDARGVISVTERQHYISRVRNLAKMTALSYIKSRQILGFPLLKQKKQKNLLPPKPISFVESDKPNDFLLEIGSEQLPAKFIPKALQSLKCLLENLFKENHLSFKQIKLFAGVRRLGVLIPGLTAKTLPKKIEKKGPAVQVAFNNKDEITKAGIGFLKSIGENALTRKDVEELLHLQIRNISGIEYLFASLEEPGVCTRTLLYEKLPQLIHQITFPKKMFWIDESSAYARPIRWIVSLYGSEVIPFSYANVTATNTSYGHQQRFNAPITISHPSQYVSALRKGYVIVNHEERKEMIQTQLAYIEESYQIKTFSLETVLKEVLYLSEYPEAKLGSFDPQYLKAPKEVLISEMVQHQKYFPVVDASSLLKAHFIVVCDQIPTKEIVDGNKRALEARLADGMFLYEEDLQIPLSVFIDKSKKITFLEGCGSLFDKSKRLKEYLEKAHTQTQFFDLSIASGAAELCKIDLASGLVNEFPNLQGVCGKIYTNHDGKDPKIAQAIEEHWMPQQENDPLPESLEGTALSVIDKVDTLIACFAQGLIPTSSSDPYALRRLALGIIKMLIHKKVDLSLMDLIESCLNVFIDETEVSFKKSEVLDSLRIFLEKRAVTIFKDFFPKELVSAISFAQGNIYDLYLRLEALHQFRQQEIESFKALLNVYHRLDKILQKNKTEHLVNPSLFLEPLEKKLHENLRDFSSENKVFLEEKKYVSILKNLSSLSPIF